MISLAVMSGRGNKVTAEAKARGERLRAARKVLRIEVHDMAALLEVRPMTVYRWEWGSSAWHVDDTERIAKAYGIRVGWLVAGESPARPKRVRRKAA